MPGCVLKASPHAMPSPRALATSCFIDGSGPASRTGFWPIVSGILKSTSGSSSQRKTCGAWATLTKMIEGLAESEDSDKLMEVLKRDGGEFR